MEIDFRRAFLTRGFISKIIHIPAGGFSLTNFKKLTDAELNVIFKELDLSYQAIDWHVLEGDCDIPVSKVEVLERVNGAILS